MKKFLFSIVAFVYLTSIIGVTLQQHYCMNKLVSWSLVEHKKDRCEKCGMEKNEKQNGCCKDVKLKVKNGYDQFKSSVPILSEKKEPQHTQNFYVYETAAKIIVAEKYLTDHGPPYLNTVPLFILYRVILT